MLRLRTELVETMQAELLRAYPEEGCGILLGREQDGVRHVERVVPLSNHSAEARGNRYLIDPEQFLLTEREGREQELDVLGFFHSHPDQPPVPSGFDLEHAWPYYSYLIVSVRQGRIDDARSWRLADDRTRFEPEPLESPAIAPAPGETR
jgi:proteasome lid subunit RPN8/RPN11